MEPIIQPIQPRKPKSRINKIGVVVFGTLFLLLVVALGSSLYFYKKANSDPQVEATKELAEVVNMVSKHMVLPKDETPTMATVSDPEKLRDQPFFINAKKGDKVLIFSGSQKAILYDPIADRIVEVAPINASAGTATQ
jgi:hypothetical protein